MLDALAESLQKKVDEWNRERTHFGKFADCKDFVLSIAAGYASYQPSEKSYEQIMMRADEKMYEEKKRCTLREGKGTRFEGMVVA